MNIRSIVLLFACLMFFKPLADAGESPWIVCGMERVFVFDHEKGEGTWQWTAADSPKIPKEKHGAFATTDDCKPYGGMILITSSSDGVALVSRSDKRCHFFTTARNAHSACLLPKNQVAVAASFGGDEVRIFDRAKSGADLKPTMTVPLYGAHGVEWDVKRKCLWALGTKELLKISIGQSSAKVDKRLPLPESGGHDLSWWDDDQLVLSVDEHCYLFAIEKGTFAPFEPLKDEVKVKSIDRSRKTGRVVWHRGAKNTWWSDTIRRLSPDDSKVLSGEKIYKVRWDEPRPIPGG